MITGLRHRLRGFGTAAGQTVAEYALLISVVVFVVVGIVYQAVWLDDSPVVQGARDFSDNFQERVNSGTTAEGAPAR